MVFIEQAQRRIPVQYAKRMIGRRMYGGTSTYIPLKVNQAGVVPVIFASSLLYLPQLYLQFFDPNNLNGYQQWIQNNLADPSHWIYITTVLPADHLLHVLLRLDHVQPDRGRGQHEEVRWFRPGHPAGQADRRLPGLHPQPDHPAGCALPGLISVLPNFFFIWLDSAQYQNFPFGGTAVLIMVGVGLETVKQIESQLMQRNYEGFLR